jgi:hypothetical protein
MKGEEVKGEKKSAALMPAHLISTAPEMGSLPVPRGATWEMSHVGIAVDGNFFVFDKPVQAANS